MRAVAKPEAAREIALGIGVDQQHFPALGGERGGEIDGGRRLSNPAFLIGDRLYLIHLFIRLFDHISL